MKFHVVGAGAIGGLTAAYLAKHGEDVHVVDVVPEHVEAINKQGLFVDGVDGEFRVSIPASLPEDVTGPLDVVLIAVKSAHTDSAVDVIEPHLNDRSLVISLQNGLNPDRIATRLGKERVAGGFINFAADYIAPGHIRYGGAGDYYLGPVAGSPDARLREIASKFNRIMNTVLTDNIMGYLWSKECYGSLLIGTALIDAPVHEILVAREHREVLAAAVAEAVEVADVGGVTLEDFEPFQAALFRAPLDWTRLDAFFDRVADRFQKRVKQHTGIWRDLRVRRRKTEVDWLTGEVIRRGETLGFDLPVSRKIVDMIREIENGQRAQDWSNLQEIHADTIGAARPA